MSGRQYGDQLKMLVTDATNLPILMNCIGSRLMPATVPPKTVSTTDRDEGNAAHWLSQKVFGGDDQRLYLNEKAYNGHVITQDMIDHVMEYLSALNMGEMEVDTSFVGEQFHINARADHVVHDPHYNSLTIDDLKYGYGIIEPEMNWSLIAHAIGYCVARQLTPSSIILRIHQPRPYHPEGSMREWTIDYNRLMELYGQIAQKLSNPTDELTSNEFCRKCQANAQCPAARKAGYNAIDASGIALIDDMDAQQISHELDVLRRASAVLKSRVEAVEELAIHKLKSGEPIPDYSLDPKYANTRWKTGITASMVEAMTGVPVAKEGIVTPNQAKNAGVSEAAVKALTEQPYTGSKLVKIEADKQARKLLKK